MFFFVFVLFFSIFWLHTAPGILVPQPGIRAVPLAVEVWYSNHGTTLKLGTKALSSLGHWFLEVSQCQSLICNK